MTYSGQTSGWSESTLILTNESQSKITRLIRVDQSHASKLVTEDRQTGTDKDGKSALEGSRLMPEPKTPSKPLSFTDIQHVCDKNKRKTVSPAESDKFKKPKALLMK